MLIGYAPDILISLRTLHKCGTIPLPVYSVVPCAEITSRVESNKDSPVRAILILY